MLTIVRTTAPIRLSHPSVEVEAFLQLETSKEKTTEFLNVLFYLTTSAAWLLSALAFLEKSCLPAGLHTTLL